MADFEERTSTRLINVMKKMEDHLPFSESLRETLEKLHITTLRCQSLEVNAIPLLESTIATQLTIERSREAFEIMDKFDRTASDFVDWAFQLEEEFKEERSKKISESEKDLLLRYFVKPSGGIREEKVEIRMEDDAAVDELGLLALKHFGLVELGVYDGKTFVSLTDRGRRALSGMRGRLLRIVKKLARSSYARLAAFISGVLFAIIADQLMYLYRELLIPIATGL